MNKETLQQYLKESGIKNFYIVHEDDPHVLAAKIRTREGVSELHLKLDDTFLWYEFSVCENLDKDERTKPDLLKFLLWGNYAKKIGGYAIDFNDGEVQFKIGMMIKGVDIKAENIDAMILCGLLSIIEDRPKIKKLLRGQPLSDVEPLFSESSAGNIEKLLATIDSEEAVEDGIFANC